MFLVPESDDPQAIEVRRLAIRPGDVLVLRLDYELADVGQADEIKARIAEVFGWPVPVMILAPGAEVGVIGPEAAGDAAGPQGLTLEVGGASGLEEQFWAWLRQGIQGNGGLSGVST